MKDENDVSTNDAFISLEDAERESLIADCLSSGGHYQALLAPKCLSVSGRRYAGSKTPDKVRDKWSTHRDVIKYMSDRFGAYDLDAAAEESNAVCEKFIDEKSNCLNRWWGKRKHIWLNPPYSHPLPFVMKTVQQMQHDNQIDILLPADNSTAWFRIAQMHAAEIIWIVGDVEMEYIGDDVDDFFIKSQRSGRLAFLSGETGKPVDNNNKGSVIFVMRKLKEGEKQQTHYVTISEICASVKNKRKVKFK